MGAVTEAAGEPDPGKCRSRSDVGRLHHDTDKDIWYECIFEPHRKVFIWTTLPPGNDDD